MTADPTIAQMLRDYYAAFSTLDADSIEPYFTQPALITGPARVASLATAVELRATFAPVMEALRARAYGRSEFSIQEIKLLGGSAAVAMGTAIRYKVDGQELERVALTYLLHKEGCAWKIAVMVIQD